MAVVMQEGNSPGERHRGGPTRVEGQRPSGGIWKKIQGKGWKLVWTSQYWDADPAMGKE